MSKSSKTKLKLRKNKKAYALISKAKQRRQARLSPADIQAPRGDF
jgi:hypothetical protein